VAWSPDRQGETIGRNGGQMVIVGDPALLPQVTALLHDAAQPA
jgi:hypothetical protein